MTASTYSPTLGDFLQTIAPKNISWDLFGFASGYRSYVIYTQLDAKSDDELEMLGLARKDIARIAVESATKRKA